jgi:hypothetical protein
MRHVTWKTVVLALVVIWIGISVLAWYTYSHPNHGGPTTPTQSP